MLLFCKHFFVVLWKDKYRSIYKYTFDIWWSNHIPFVIFLNVQYICKNRMLTCIHVLTQNVFGESKLYCSQFFVSLILEFLGPHRCWSFWESCWNVPLEMVDFRLLHLSRASPLLSARGRYPLSHHIFFCFARKTGIFLSAVFSCLLQDCTKHHVICLWATPVDAKLYFLLSTGEPQKF